MSKPHTITSERGLRTFGLGHTAPRNQRTKSASSGKEMTRHMRKEKAPGNLGSQGGKGLLIVPGAIGLWPTVSSRHMF